MRGVRHLRSDGEDSQSIQPVEVGSIYNSGRGVSKFPDLHPWEHVSGWRRSQWLCEGRALLLVRSRKLPEVVKSLWTYSYWHALTAMNGILLVFIELAILVTIGDIVLEFNARA